MKRLGIFSLLLFFSLVGFSQTQLSRGNFGNGASIDANSASYQLKAGINSNGFRAQQMLLATNTIDSLALVDLYNSTNGAAWANSTNWLTGTVETWYGISVDGSGRVGEINLSSNNLDGTLPESLWDLTSLIRLYLSGNFLTGTISGSLVNLTLLEEFEINFQQSGGFTGNFPNALASITSIININTRDNNFTGAIDGTIWELPNLQHFSLSGGDSLTLNIPAVSAKIDYLNISVLAADFSGGIPDFIIQQSNLQNLSIDWCQISGDFPVATFNNLFSLELAGNVLTSIDNITSTNFPSLQYLGLYENQLASLPDLSAFASLSNIDITNNFLHFDEIENLKNNSSASIAYVEQRLLPIALDTTVVYLSSVTLVAAVGGSLNNYQWYKDGALLPGEVATNLTIASMNSGDIGGYYLEITSDTVTDLTLQTENFNIFMSTPAQDYYWIGDGGNWLDLSHWSLTSGGAPTTLLPDANDDVYFDSLSFNLPGQIVTILDDTTTVGVEVSSMNWTGVANDPTFQVKATVSSWIYNRIFGSLIFDPNMILDFNGAEFYFAPEQDYVLDTKGLYLGDNCWLAFNFGWADRPGANVTCDVLSDINPAGIYINKGRVNLNGNNVVEKDSHVWLAGDSTTLDATGSSLDVSRLTLNESTIDATIITDSSTFKVSTVLRTNGLVFNNVILSDSAKVQLYSNTFNRLEILPGSNVVFESDTIQNIVTLIASGTAANPITISASILDTAAVFNVSGAANINYVTIKDNIGTGGAIFNAYNSLDSGNVVGWNFVTDSSTYYWVGDGGNWFDANHWAYSSGGVDYAPFSPEYDNDVRFDSLSFTQPDQIVSVFNDDNGRGLEAKTLDWTGVLNNPTFEVKAISSTFITSLVWGSIIFDTNMNLDFFGADFFMFSDEDYILDTKGLYLGDNGAFIFNLDLNVFEFSSATCDIMNDINSSTLALYGGTVNLNGNNFTGRTDGFILLQDSCTLNVTGSNLKMSSLTHPDGANAVSIIDDNAIIHITKRLRTDSQSYNHMVFSDSVEVLLYSNTFNRLEILPGANVTFESDSTQYIGSFIANGTSSEPISISATKLDTAAVLNVASGEVNVNYVTFKDNTVTGGAVFNALNSLDSGNVTGWNFLANKVLFTPDSLALVALYNMTNGINWTNNTNWLVGRPDTWFGITITDSRVVNIDLGENNLIGSIPAELGDLSDLQQLILITNQLTDSIPPELGNLSKLTNLWLYGNELTGPIPPQLGDLDSLITLWLHDNQLTGPIPSEIGNLINLQKLELPSNQLTGPIPAELGNLTNLQDMTLNFNQLTGAIPAELGNLDSLRLLLLNNNHLEGSVPPELTNLSSIQNLRLEFNNLTDLPDLSTLGTLTNFNVSDNLFTFEDLEPNVGITGITYTPMNSTKQATYTLLNVGDSITINANTGGANNQYSWLINGASSLVAADSLTLTNITFADEGEYYAEITNSVVTGLTLRSDTFNIYVSSLQRDSIALHNMYNLLDGTNWTSASNWTSGSLDTWEGVVIRNNRVAEWSMPSNNLEGDLPRDIKDIENLEIVTLQGNLLTSIPDVNSLLNITSFDVSQNNLEFGSLELNIGVPGFTYADQDSIGVGGDLFGEADLDFQFDFVTSGITNNYQWYKQGILITGSTSSIITLPTIRRAEMGKYYVEVTNDSVPGLTLTSKSFELFAQTDVSGTIKLNDSTSMTDGDVLLMKITSTGGYDTTSVVSASIEGGYTHNDIILADYIILVQPDTTTHKDFLPTYYSGTFLWEAADTVFLDSAIIALDIILQGGPSSEPTGEGKIFGIVEEDIPEGGRLEAKRRVAGAGVSVRRGRRHGRLEDHEYDLVGYVYTNEEGEFDFNNLEEEEYLINIQYPGYPMDETSNILITVGTELESDIEVVALVAEGKIAVTIIEVTGIAKTRFYEKVEFYPNPATEFIYLKKLPQDVSLKAIIFDLKGKVILTSNNIQNGIDVRSLNHGMYILKVMEEGNIIPVITSRLMIRNR